MSRIRNYLYHGIKRVKNEYNYFVRSEKKFKKLTPTVFAIEVALGCNLKCPECTIGNSQITRKKGMMSFNEFEIIADKIQPFAEHVYLHLYGEPLLNNDIFSMIEYTSKFSSVNISTNGQLVTPEIAERLIVSGVRDLIVSIDGVTQEVYEKYRVGGDVRKAFNALEKLVYYNDKYGNHVHIMPQFVVFRHNEHEIARFCEICASLGVKPFFKSPFISKKSLFERPSDRQYWRENFSSLKKYVTALSRDCDAIRDSMTILLDGSVVLCCYDHQGTRSFGNIFQKDVLEIWNSSEYSNMRYAIYNGKIPKFCLNNCLMYYYDGNYASVPDIP